MSVLVAEVAALDRARRELAAGWLVVERERAVPAQGLLQACAVARLEAALDRWGLAVACWDVRLRHVASRW